jgi:hypothetical protein
VEPEVSESYSVAIVLDQDFGGRLAELARRMHVWVCASEQNKNFAQEYWDRIPGTL